MTYPYYPHLGFNPAPGSTDAVRRLRRKLVRCAEVLDETHGMVTRLMDGGYWKGDAAVAFRRQVEDGPLPLNLRNAARSIRKAARQLDAWEADLDDFQRRAAHLNDQAHDARAALRQAEATRTADHTDRGGTRPELGKHGAAAHPDDAEQTLRRLNAAVDDAQAELERILAKARRLAAEHEDQAARRAVNIRNATDKLAPHEPGLFEELGEWITDNLPDILATAAAVVGFVSLFIATGGTAAALLLIGAALSAGALATRVSDPVVRASLWDGIAEGELDRDFWNNAIGTAGDLLGVLPGLGAARQGVLGSVDAVRSGAEALTLGQKIATFGTQTEESMRAVAALENPVVNRVVHAVGGAPRVGEVIEISTAAAGVATSGIDLIASRVEALDNDVVSGTSTTVGGVQIAGINSGEVIALARHVF